MTHHSKKFFESSYVVLLYYQRSVILFFFTPGRTSRRYFLHFTDELDLHGHSVQRVARGNSVCAQADIRGRMPG